MAKTPTRTGAVATFSTRSDNFLSASSALYAESMLEMYENDPNSVPEVSLYLFVFEALPPVNLGDVTTFDHVYSLFT